MAVRRKARSHRKASADKELESLLRRAAAYFRARKSRRASRKVRKQRRAS
jgi:hypothetical protein